MTLGTGTFVPGGRFSFPRSYINVFTVNVDTDSIVNTDGHIVFLDPANHAVNFHVVIDPRFWNWSSNKWTLDFVIEQSYYRIDPSPTENPMPFVLAFHAFDNLANHLVFQPFGLDFLTYHSYDYPPAPPGYWLPTP